MAAILVKGYRPSKHSAIPPPLYLTSTGPPPAYCHTCGRVVSSRKSKPSTNKFCSERCKRHKPSSSDRAIEDALWSLLSDDAVPEGLTDTRRRPGKGETRLVVPVSLVSAAVFGVEAKEDSGSDDEDGNDDGYDEAELKRTLERLKGRGQDEKTDAAGKAEADDGAAEAAPGKADEEKRKEGQVRAARRERVRNACRRAVVFGLLPPGEEEVAEKVDEVVEEEQPKPKGKKGKTKDVPAPPKTSRRRCEAVMRGGVVEPSYAKGDWGVRWAEER